VRGEVRSDDPFSYAPRWARGSPPADVHSPTSVVAPPTAPAIDDPLPASVTARRRSPAQPAAAAPSAPLRVTDSPPMAPGIGGPNLELPQQLRPFEGDVAIKVLRRRLTLDPDFVPQPPIRAQARDIIPWAWRLSVVFVVAATVAFAATLMLVSRGARQH